MASGWRSPLFFLILAVYLLAGVLFATLTPNWQAPDEPAHYNYIRYLAGQGQFPELIPACYNQAYLEQLKSQRFPPELPLDTLCYEFHQPPLYYLLATPIFRLSGGALLALRLWSVVLGLGVVALAWDVARLVFPGQTPIIAGTMALVAFTPMHVAMLASVNNDALAELLLAVLLLLLTGRLVGAAPASTRSDITLGLILGLGLITKVTVYIALPLVAATLWLASPHPNDRPEASAYFNKIVPPQLARQSLVIFGLAGVVALPWYVRNAALYGQLDVLGLGRHDAVVAGQLRTAEAIAAVGWQTYLLNFVTTTFHSFWGQFGWMAVPMSQRVYVALTLLSLAGLAGLGFWLLDWKLRGNTLSAAPRTRRLALGLMALAIGLMVLGYLWYNLEFAQFQGRYLFPALIPLGLFFSLGLYKLLASRRAWVLAGGLALALVWVVITGLVAGDVDNWAVLIVGAPLALALARAWLSARWPVPASWLLAGVYAALALLTLISPFWYVIPYLSP